MSILHHQALIATSAITPRLATVSFSASNPQNTEDEPDDIFSGVFYRSDGSEQKCNSSGTYLGFERGDWLDAGVASDCWIERILVSGTLFSDFGTSRLQMSVADRELQVKRLISEGFGITSAVVIVRMFDAASGGNLLDLQQLNIRAIAEDP